MRSCGVAHTVDSRLQSTDALKKNVSNMPLGELQKVSGRRALCMCACAKLLTRVFSVFSVCFWCASSCSSGLKPSLFCKSRIQAHEGRNCTACAIFQHDRRDGARSGCSLSGTPRQSPNPKVPYGRKQVRPIPSASIRFKQATVSDTFQGPHGDKLAAHNTQHTTHNAQHTTHNTQHTTHNTHTHTTHPKCYTNLS